MNQLYHGNTVEKELLFTAHSARCFRAYFARKFRVTRRDAMKSELFHHNQRRFFAVSVHRKACYCLHHAAFWHGVNSNRGRIRA